MLLSDTILLWSCQNVYGTIIGIACGVKKNAFTDAFSVGMSLPSVDLFSRTVLYNDMLDVADFHFNKILFSENDSLVFEK